MKKRQANRDFSDICDVCFEFIKRKQLYVRPQGITKSNVRHWSCHLQKKDSIKVGGGDE